MGDVLLVNDELAAVDLDRALDEVSPERRAYAMGYRFERDRRLSVAAYLLLKRALSDGFGLAENPRFVRNENGKPFLRDHPEILFNISHCPIAVACIVSNRPVGIDIEEIAPVDWDVARRVLSDAEFAEVRASSEPEVSFASFWTRKEALVKMRGDAIVEGRLPSLLSSVTDCRLETKVNRVRGYVLTAAYAEGESECTRSCTYSRFML